MDPVMEIPVKLTDKYVLPRKFYTTVTLQRCINYIIESNEQWRKEMSGKTYDYLVDVNGNGVPVKLTDTMGEIFKKFGEFGAPDNRILFQLSSKKVDRNAVSGQATTNPRDLKL
jgi:hypothetical protein